MMGGEKANLLKLETFLIKNLPQSTGVECEAVENPL